MLMGWPDFQISYRDDVLKQLREDLGESQAQYTECYDQVSVRGHSLVMESASLWDQPRYGVGLVMGTERGYGDRASR